MKKYGRQKMTSEISSGYRCENVIHFRCIWWDNTKAVRKSRQGKFSRTSTDCTSFVCFTILVCEIVLSTNQILDTTKIGKLHSARLNTCLVILIASDMLRWILHLKLLLHLAVPTCLNFIKCLLCIHYSVGRYFNFIVYNV